MTSPREQHLSWSDVAESPEEAAERFNVYKSRDPFPEIPAALLNSADIHDYVRATGMIHPFDKGKLKPASCEACVGKDCIFWDDEGKEKKIDLSRGKSFVLQPNSIAFVTTRERFRLPDYMAVRFNLRITNVHRGLLLGTGPLVDPGFEGHILIPLHNLTTNKYKFCYGEKLIWLEFTKISPHDRWHTTDDPTRTKIGSGHYVRFPDGKKNVEPRDYLKEPEIRSSIPDAIQEAQKSAREAQRSAERSEGWARGFAIGGFVGFLVVVIAALGLYRDIRSITGDLKEKQGMETERVAGLRDKVDELKEDIETEEKQRRAMEKQVDIMQTRIDALREKLEASVSSGQEKRNQAETSATERLNRSGNP